MLYHDTININTINVTEGNDVNKISKSKECDICHYWYILNEGY